MDIEPIDCNHEGCLERWPHLHILPLAQVLSFHSLEASTIASKYIELKRGDSWYPALCAKLDAEGFSSGIRVTEFENRCIKDGHHRLLYCRDRGQYWCPIEVNYDISYDYPDEWGAEDYGWKPIDEWETSRGWQD